MSKFENIQRSSRGAKFCHNSKFGIVRNKLKLSQQDINFHSRPTNNNLAVWKVLVVISHFSEYKLFTRDTLEFVEKKISSENLIDRFFALLNNLKILCEKLLFNLYFLGGPDVLSSDIGSHMQPLVVFCFLRFFQTLCKLKISFLYLLEYIKIFKFT